MASHDDVDDANDETSSEHEFELPFPRRSASSAPASDADDAANEGDSALTDQGEVPTAGVFDLDAALNASGPPAVAPATDVPPPPPSPSDFTRIDLNDEFERSDVSADLEPGMPSWATAPAPDPNQAVSELDAPNDAPEDQFVAASNDDPYQIPADYTTPDFFASRISRRSPAENENDAEAAAVAVHTARSDSEAGPGTNPDVSADFHTGANSHTGADAAEPHPASDAFFDSLFATGDPEPRSEPEESSYEAPSEQASSVAEADSSDSADDSAADDNFWKLEPLEPNTGTVNAASANDEHLNALGSDTTEETAPDGVEETAQTAGPAAPASVGFSADLFTAVSAEFEPQREDAPHVEAESNGAEPAEPVAAEEDEERYSPFVVPSDGPSADSPFADSPDADRSPADSEPVDSADASERAETSEITERDDIPTPPARRSMADEELLTWADDPENQSTGTLSVIEVLEAQLRLREEEAREYREWESTLRSRAGAATDADAENLHPNSTPLDSTPLDSTPLDSTSSDSTSSADSAHSDAAVPDSAASDGASADSSEDATTAPTLSQQATVETSSFVPAAAPATPLAPLPAWNVAPPSDAWAPGEDFDDEIPFAAYADPTGPVTLPVLAEAESATETAPSPEFPEDEEGDSGEIPFAPPPLVEPETAGSAPRSNLEEHVSFGDFGFTPPVSAVPKAASEESADTGENELPRADDEGAGSPFAFELDAPASSVAATTPFEQPPLDSEPPTPISEEEPVPSAFSFACPETPPYVPVTPVSFDELLKTDHLDEPDESVVADEGNPLDAVIADPDAARRQQSDPLSAVHTGSISIAEAHNEAEADDAVDASDRLTYATELPAPQLHSDSNPIPFAVAPVAPVAPVGPAAPASATVAGSPPSAATAVPQPVPLASARVSQQPLGLGDVAPTAQRVFSLEESGLEPTPIDRRIGQAARLFWLWFAANSSIVSIGLGAAVFSVGMSLRQSVVAILAGVALSFIPLGLTTLAGKRSGQPTMVISRSAFGIVGNIVPSIVALIARLFWGAVLLWVLGSSVAIVLVGSDLNAGLGDRQLLLIALALSFLVALVIAFAGYPLFARIQLILSIISGALVVGLIAFTAEYVDVAQALTTPDGSWLLTITGAVLVFSFLGLVWAYSGADIARYQRPSSSGPASALSASFGTTVPAFVLIAYGALLAASDPEIARGFLASPLDTLLLLLPGWYPVPLLLAAALSLLSGITLSLYSGGFALQAVGVRIPRQWSIVVVGALLGALAVLFAFGVDGGINELFRDVATTLAVPTAAWAGIFAAEAMIRTRRLDSAALTARGGIYPDVRWVNLSAFLVISAIGFSLTSATIQWLSWQGYGFVALGVNLSSELAGTDVGVLVALALGILTPIVAGVPAIRRQEAGSSQRAVRAA